MRDLAIAATVCLAATFPFAAPAHAFTARTGLSSSRMRTALPSLRGMAEPADFWCAAGDYAIRALHMNPTEVVYRAPPPRRGSGEPVRFTLDPSQSAEKTGLFILGAQGGGITAGHAQSLCENRLFRK